MMFSATPTLNLYATAGRGFETPTLNELAYPARRHGRPEPGARAGAQRQPRIRREVKLAAAGDLAAALFRTDTEDEIVTQTNVGGRSTFQNAGRTRREGFELSWSALLHDWLRARTAYTYVDARYRDAFASCAATPCTAPNRPFRRQPHPRHRALVDVRRARLGSAHRLAGRRWTSARSTTCRSTT
jgi:iron complex outermembrane receptor protein